MDMGELGRLVDAHRGRQKYGATDSQIARALGVTRSTVGNWVRGTSMPSPANLRALAAHIETSYMEVLDAALVDAGYLQQEAHRDRYAAPITRAGVSPADELASRRPAAVVSAPEAEIDRALEEAARPKPKLGSMRERIDIAHGDDEAP